MKIQDFQLKKQTASKISMVTCYDHPSACTLAKSNIDCVLVGDSVAMAVHGYDTTIMATLEMMVLHTQAVAKGLTGQFLICDLPFLCHKGSLDQTIQNVKQLFKAGAQAIKIEGADPDTCKTIGYLVQAGIPVIGHIGLTAQMIHQLGGYRIQGKSKAQEEVLLQQGYDLEQAGCFALVIECVPQQVAHRITTSLKIPTIGIGAGWGTDGQVLVWHDLLGLQSTFSPKFLKKYAKAQDLFIKAINTYVQEVQQGIFPADEHCFKMENNHAAV
ncbi:MAG: 3-methyl-2-oxobutanoate hydroxymethyltransferase [Legionella sp.]|nr:3-methyl-2-oxobutanoate hydroxymethyltransferase [Legionella sp.]